MPRAGNIDYEARRARLEAEADAYGQPLSATANTVLLVCCVLWLALVVVGVALAKAWGWLS